jgi:hypothetical protein
LNDEAAFEVWPGRMDLAITALNNRKLESLGGYSPRELLFGQADNRRVYPAAATFLQNAANLRSEGMSARDKDVLRRQMPETKQVKPFYQGQLVQVYDPRKDDTHEAVRKLKSKWSGPYRIVELGRSSAILSTPDGDPAGRAGFDRLRPWRGVMARDEEGNRKD